MYIVEVSEHLFQTCVTMSDVTHVPVSCEPRPQVTPAHLVTS